MTDTSPILAMPYIQPSQAQKHVTHNEALRLLDVIVQLVVQSVDLSTPPATAVEGDRYIVAPPGQGAWAGHAADIAAFVDGVWQFTPPLQGWSAQVLESGTEVVFEGAAWVARSLSNLSGLGIGASFDSYNRLVVASEAVLLNNAGAGHQLKINKATAEDTASLLFQTGYGGRAEMGTAGSDDFTLKVSGDGSTWTEALRIDAVTGRVTAGVSGWRVMLAEPRIYHVDQVQGDDAGDGLSDGVGAFSTIARALAVAGTLDSGGHDVTVQLAAGTYDAPVAVERPLVGGGRLILQGNADAPGQVVLSGVGSVLTVAGDLLLRGITVENDSASTAAITVSTNGSLALDAVTFGSAGGHVDVVGGHLRLEGVCAVNGSAAFHLRLRTGARFDGNGQVLTVSGTPDFTEAFLICADASIATLNNESFVGDATGKRFDISANAVVRSGGSILPGDLPGSVETGGLLL